MEVILNNEEMIPSKLMNQADIDENTKFWLKFAAGHGKDKQSSILAVELPTLTNIKTQNNESKKKYNVLQRKQQSTNTMVTISTSSEYASNITNNIVQQQYSPP